MYDYDRRQFVAAAHPGLALVHRLVDKYARLLGVTELPDVAVRNNLRSKWLGRLTATRGKKNLMEIQVEALADEVTTERVVAHEMCHHVEMLELTDQDFEMLKVGIRPASHGPKWREQVAKVNAVMGADFVTEKSDANYAVAKTTKPYMLLITNTIGANLGYAIGVRMSPRMQTFTARRLEEGAKLLQTTDPKWAKGPKIGAGWAVPREPEARAELERLFRA